MSNRFVPVSFDEALKAENAESEYYLEGEPDYEDEFKSYLLDTYTNRIIFADGGEAEDQFLGRDLRKFVDHLNILAREIDDLNDEIRYLEGLV